MNTIAVLFDKQMLGCEIIVVILIAILLQWFSHNVDYVK
jgi:hypothetical protein